MLETQQQHLFISELQLNLFQSADTNLTKLNRIAARELQRLARPSLGNGVYNPVFPAIFLGFLRFRCFPHCEFGEKCTSPGDNSSRTSSTLFLAPSA